MKDSSTWKRVPIKEELFALTKGMIRAAILNQFLYWSERVKDYAELITEEQSRTTLMPETELEHGWIYKKLEELDSEIMAGLTPQGLKPHIEYLIENGWLLRRRNPKVKWDKTYQYRVNIIKVQNDLLGLGYHLEGYKYQSIAISFSEVRTKNIEVRTKESEFRMKNTEIRTKENHDSNQDILQAIPEITIETTPDITTDNTIENTPDNTSGGDYILPFLPSEKEHKNLFPFKDVMPDYSIMMSMAYNKRFKGKIPDISLKEIETIKRAIEALELNGHKGVDFIKTSESYMLPLKNESDFSYEDLGQAILAEYIPF